MLEPDSGLKALRYRESWVARACTMALMRWSVCEAEQLVPDAEFDSMALLADRFAQLRRCSPTFLDTFDFHAASARQDLMNAIEALREMNRTAVRKVPADAPTAFIKPRWGRFVFKERGIDLRFYELAAMSELKNALRSGDVSILVGGS